MLLDMEATISRGIRLRADVAALVEKRAAADGTTFNDYIKESIDAFVGLSERKYRELLGQRNDLRDEVFLLLDEVRALEKEKGRLQSDRWKLLRNDQQTDLFETGDSTARFGQATE